MNGQNNFFRKMLYLWWKEPQKIYNPPPSLLERISNFILFTSSLISMLQYGQNERKCTLYNVHTQTRPLLSTFDTFFFANTLTNKQISIDWSVCCWSSVFLYLYVNINRKCGNICWTFEISISMKNEEK